MSIPRDCLVGAQIGRTSRRFLALGVPTDFRLREAVTDLRKPDIDSMTADGRSRSLQFHWMLSKQQELLLARSAHRKIT